MAPSETKVAHILALVEEAPGWLPAGSGTSTGFGVRLTETSHGAAQKSIGFPRGRTSSCKFYEIRHLVFMNIAIQVSESTSMPHV